MELKACIPSLGQRIMGMKRSRAGSGAGGQSSIVPLFRPGRSPRFSNPIIMTQKLSKFVIILIETST
jgi:hypothetical protein